MTKLNIHEAKTHLSKYLPLIQRGETILLCKNGVPIAQITPLPKKKRSIEKLFGIAKDKVIDMSHFDDPLTEKDLPGMGL
ncbi:MAG: type II toxin-antitoxin system Phd/YefM family antitoxin [Deltaproteobacteria bacterium]|nr:type II toxin-antitoxin system Phd/YefM family antitoxin [Deltaproteobacteria bacterium]